MQVHAEEISGNNGYVELSFCAKKLDDKVRRTTLVLLNIDGKPSNHKSSDKIALLMSCCLVILTTFPSTDNSQNGLKITGLWQYECQHNNLTYKWNYNPTHDVKKEMCFSSVILKQDVIDPSCSGPHMFKLSAQGTFQSKRQQGPYIYLQFWLSPVTLCSLEKALGERLHGVTLIRHGTDSKTAGAFSFESAATNLPPLWQLNRLELWTEQLLFKPSW